MTAQALQLPAVGERIGEGRFELTRQLGEGGMSMVFAAEDRLLGREVALKLLTPRYVGRPARELRFINEAAYLRRVQGHPNIIELIDAGRLQDRRGWPWLSTEILPGEALSWLSVRGKLAPARVIELAVQIARALQACHAVSVVHRDVTPNNLFVLEDQRTVKLFDFSHAADLRGPKLDAGAPERLTGVCEAPGTIGYMGPEQAISAPAEVSMDAFGFGMVLFKLVTGRNPYRQFNDRDAFIRAQRDGALEPPRLHAWAYDVPELLATLVHECTQREGAMRPTMAEVVGRLERLEASAPAVVPGSGLRSVESSASGEFERTATLDALAIIAASRRPSEPAAAAGTGDGVPSVRPVDSPTEPDATPLVPVRAEAAPGSPGGPAPESGEGEPILEATRITKLSARKAVAGVILLLFMTLVAWVAYERGKHAGGKENQEKNDVGRDQIAVVTDDHPGARSGPDIVPPADAADAADPVDIADIGELVPGVEPDLGSASGSGAGGEQRSATGGGSRPGPSLVCEGVEERAQAAAAKFDWQQVESLTKKKHHGCWSSPRERSVLRVKALFELDRWPECVKAAGNSTDPRISTQLELCRKFSGQE